MKTIALATLQKKGACFPSRKRFEDAFGKKVVVTEERAKKYAPDFDWEWATDNLLKKEVDVEAYFEIQNKANESYYRAIDKAWAVYRKDDDFAKKLVAIRRAQAKFDRKRAVAFARLYIAQ